jgi:hypothetical protein
MISLLRLTQKTAAQAGTDTGRADQAFGQPEKVGLEDASPCAASAMLPRDALRLYACFVPDST